MQILKKTILHSVLFFGYICCAQYQCPKIESPLDGDTDVAVDSQVSWNTVGGIDGYSVSLGTSPGASDILNSRSAALVNYLEPSTGLPDATEIFVTISLFLDDGTFVTCPTESFTTVDITTPPGCTVLDSTLANMPNVSTGENIVWEYAPTASGYRVAIGTAPDNFDILPETDLGNVLQYDPTESLPVNSEIFVKLIPYNDNGDAAPCALEQFTTGDSNIDCEQFRPEITLPETIGICPNETETVVASEDVASGFRWYRVSDDGSEQLIAEGSTVSLSNIGRYRYEAYTDVSLLGEKSECASSSYFSVVSSEVATVEDVLVDRAASGVELTVIVSGGGTYEFALDEEDGPFQDSNVFSDVSDGNHLIYVRDKNGCGVLEYDFIQTIAKNDFPNFFTPNGDNTNDYWQFTPVFDTQASLEFVYIYDRFGKFLLFIDPESRGWDGTFQGRPMPSSTYWYRALSKNGKEVQGYFALKR